MSGLNWSLGNRAGSPARRTSAGRLGLQADQGDGATALVQRRDGALQRDQPGSVHDRHAVEANDQRTQVRAGHPEAGHGLLRRAEEQRTRDVVDADLATQALGDLLARAA